MTVDPVLDHLWQSTLVAAALGMLTLAFRRTLAQTRYAIWLAASLKFLIPFATLTALGSRFDWRLALPQTPPEWTTAIEAVSQPFSAPPVDIVFTRAMGADANLPIATIAAGIWIAGSMTVLAVWLLRWRAVAAAVRAGAPIVSGRIHDAFQRLSSTIALPLIASDGSLEPGVFGIRRPVLLWPRDIDVRLDDAQVHAVLAHELAHARRRDNLTAAMHMVVEVIFWFYPLVWWIGARLVDERERACDEDVVRLGNDPVVYAESILKTCQFFLESPLTCVPGVTGSDLKKRIERIMSHRPGSGLNAWSKTLLLTAAAVTLIAPVVSGALTTPRRPPAIDLSRVESRRTFEVATITANKTGAMRVMMRVQPGSAWEGTNVTLESMIRLAYRIQESQLVGGPAWLYNDRFDIVAKSAEGAPGAEFGLRMQSLLTERFNLTLHKETRELPIYALVVARRNAGPGPLLTPSTVDCADFGRGGRGAVPAIQTGRDQRPKCGTINGPGRLTGGGATMQQLAQSLSQYTGRMVIDKTELAGGFDYELEFAPDPALLSRGPGGGLPGGGRAAGATPVPLHGLPVFAAVQAQLGLRLDAQRAPIDVLVVDSAEQPTEN